MKKLRETINNREPIKVYIKDINDAEWTYLGVYEYNKELKRYEGEIGSISLEKLAEYIAGSNELDHLKIEGNDK